MRCRLGSARVRWLLVGALASAPAVAQQPAGGAAEQERLRILGTQSRAVQLEPANQQFLVAFARRAAALYLHRLDSLSCRALFGMGDEARYTASIGSTDGSLHNRFFIEGDESPHHVDGGPYVFPTNSWEKYWPATPRLNTYWHEVQHDLMVPAGIDVPVGPYRELMEYGPREADGHHVLIEGVGQRASVAYALLQPFEEAVRRADRLESQWIAEGRNPSDDYGLQRQAWGEAHQLFSAFLKEMLRVPVVPASALADYRAATGVFFSSAEKVAEFYRTGGLKRLDRGEALGIRPPTWVFWPDLFLMPVQVQILDANRRDLEEAGALATAPSETKSGTFRQSFTVVVKARGSAYRLKEAGRQENLLVGNAVRRGTLRLRIVEEDTLARLTMSQGTSTTVDGEGPRRSFFVLDLAAVNSQPVRVTFVRRAVSLLKKPTTFHLTLEYTDAAAPKLYDVASAQLSFTLGTGSGTPAGAAGGSAGAVATAPAAPTPPAPAAPGAPPIRDPVGVTVGWGPLPGGLSMFKGGMYDKGRGLGDPPVLPASGEMEMTRGPTAYLERGDRNIAKVFIELYSNTYDRTFATLEEFVSIQFSPEKTRYGPRFEHSETKVGGFRAFRSIHQGWAERGGQQHYFVELDPQRHLYAVVLTDMTFKGTGRGEFGDVLRRDVTQFVAGLRFTLPAAQALALTKSVPPPVPKALADEPIVDNEIAKRPPPPPAAGGGGDGGRRRRTGAAPAATPPTAPGAGGVAGAGTAAGGAGSSTTSTTAASAPVAGASAGAAAGASAGAATSATTTGDGTRGGAATAPAGAAPGAPSSTAANASGELNGRGSLDFNGGSPVVTLTNDSREHWTRCTITVPGRRSYKSGTLPSGTGRDYPLKLFTPNAEAPSLTTEALVQCAEGKLSVPADLSSISPDSLAAAISRSTQAATDAAKKAADGVKKAFGGLFKKKP